MYEIIKSVINSKRYELTDILKKIDTLWLQNNITDEQKSELENLARDNAIPENSHAPLQRQVDALFVNCEELAKAIKAVSDRVTKLEGGEVTPPETEEYPEYKRPTGAHDSYHAGDKITFNGMKYICVAPEGIAVIWNPEEYPAYWELVEENEKLPEEPILEE